MVFFKKVEQITFWGDVMVAFNEYRVLQTFVVVLVVVVLLLGGVNQLAIVG